MAVITHDMIMKKVLAQGNVEQNAFYPPSIYDEHIQTVTAFVLDYAVAKFAETQQVIDIANPFMKRERYPVVDGVVTIPIEYRNLLGVSFNVTEDFKKDCGCIDDKGEKRVFENDPLAESPREEKDRIQKARCISRPISMLDVDEYNERTVHPYKKPTYKNAIGCIQTKKEVKICPYDISSVEMIFLKNPLEYKYGYIKNPDETFVYDKNSSVECEWEHSALSLIVRGMTALYSVYSKDGEMKEWSTELNKIGLF